MELAGYLHDLGKLGIPLELLEKPGSFSHEDFAVMKRHPYSTYAVLDGIRELEDVKRWGAFHHERLDGSGYPFGLQGRQLDTGSRVLAVADVLTAMSEDRPYRPGLPKNTRVRILTDLARTNQLDSDVIGITLKNFDMLDEARRIAQASASVAYEHLHLVA
jgi:HD-GYP domain-containing protein (c-di-GMP phosphodiesterase class II)